MSYHHFTVMERAKIELMLKADKTASDIAQELERHPSSVRREIQRNSDRQGYCAERAEKRYAERRKACRPKLKVSAPRLREYVIEKIAEDEFSPELVAGRLVIDFPDDPRMRVCHETLYQAIYNNHYHLDFLIELLPQARPKRRKRGQGKTRRGPSIPNRAVSYTHLRAHET